MTFDKNMLTLYAVTDAAWLNGRSLYEVTEQAIQGGATMVQLREKDRAKCAWEAKKLVPLCRKYKVPLIVNDYADIALSCGADGVHVGQRDMEAGKVREILGKDKVLGVSVQTIEQARLAWQMGADYFGVGAVFPTSTKLDADTVSLQKLAEICQSIPVPVCAIGGISQENIKQLRGSGIAGIALVSAIFGADDIAGACQVLRKLADEVVQ